MWLWADLSHPLEDRCVGGSLGQPPGSRAPCRPRTRLCCSHPGCCGRSYTCTLSKSFLSQLSVLTQDLGTHCSPSCLLSLSKFSSSVAFSTTGASSAFLPPAPVQPDYQLQEGRDITKPTAITEVMDRRGWFESYFTGESDESWSLS